MQAALRPDPIVYGAEREAVDETEVDAGVAHRKAPDLRDKAAGGAGGPEEHERQEARSSSHVPLPGVARWRSQRAIEKPIEKFSMSPMPMLTRISKRRLKRRSPPSP